MNLKRVTFIDQYSTVGGGQIVLAQLIRIFLNLKYEVSVLAPMGGELESRLRSEFESSIHYLNLIELPMTQGKKKFSDYLKIAMSPILLLPHLNELKKSSLVYVNGGRFFAAWWLLNKTLRIPSLYHLHLNHSKIEQRLIYNISKDVQSHIICISQFVYSNIVKSFPAIKNKTSIVENSLSARLSQLPFEFRKSKTKNIAVLGRISKEKGQDTVVSIAKLFSDMNFYIIGSSDFANQDFEIKIKRYAPPNVTFVGKVADVKATLDAHKIQVSIVPSKWEEPFGLTAIESMALSCLTLVSHKGELPHISRKTGAWMYSLENELIRTLQDLEKKSEDELELLTSDMYAKTIQNYSFKNYEIKMSALLTTLNLS